MGEILENKVPQKCEYGTPSEIISPVRALMGGIDFDPCSSPEFNRLVGATMFCTEEMNGFDFPWCGRVWLNPPGGRGGKKRIPTKAWWKKLVEAHRAGEVEQACYMNFALDSFQWSQGRGLTPITSYPTLVFGKRIHFYTVENGVLQESKRPTRPCALTWLPPKGCTEAKEMFRLLSDMLNREKKFVNVVL